MSALLTKAEAAKKLRVVERTLDRWRAAGLLKAVKIKGKGKVFFAQEQLDAFVRKHTER